MRGSDTAPAGLGGGGGMLTLGCRVIGLGGGGPACKPDELEAATAGLLKGGKLANGLATGGGMEGLLS